MFPLANGVLRFDEVRFSTIWALRTPLLRREPAPPER